MGYLRRQKYTAFMEEGIIEGDGIRGVWNGITLKAYDYGTREEYRVRCIVTGCMEEGIMEDDGMRHLWRRVL